VIPLPIDSVAEQFLGGHAGMSIEQAIDMPGTVPHSYRLRNLGAGGVARSEAHSWRTEIAMALQNVKPDLLEDDDYAEVRAFLHEHNLNPTDEPAILAAIRERGWDLEITGSEGDWEIEISEPGPSGPVQFHILQDTNRQRLLLRGVRYALSWLTTRQALELFDLDTRQMLGMSAEEFVRKYDAGELDRNDPYVRHLLMLRPLGT
jgi:hypothetical protein